MENRISIVLSDAEQAEILTQLKNIENALPWLISLDKGEVIGDLKLDKDSMLYLEETLNILHQTEALISSEKKEEFIKDVNLYRKLMPIMLVHDQLGNKLRKTMMRTGQEINAVFREAYKVLQVRAQHDSTYQIYLDKLTPYFKKFGKKPNGADNGQEK